MTTDNPLEARFRHPRYTIRSKFFRLFGGAYHIYDPAGQLVLYSAMKRFRLKEDIRLYTDESQSSELLRISTQSILDISGAYDVHDSSSGERLGTLKRAGIGSTFVRDQWAVLDGTGQEVGEIIEDSTLKGLVRRYVEIASIFMPQRYHVQIGGRDVAAYHQQFNPIIYKLDVDLSGDQAGTFDPRLALAAGVLLSAIEGRQS